MSHIWCDNSLQIIMYCKTVQVYTNYDFKHASQDWNVINSAIDTWSIVRLQKKFLDIFQNVGGL